MDFTKTTEQDSNYNHLEKMSVSELLININNEDKVDGEIINLGTEVEHTTQEGIEAVETVIGKAIKINHVEARAGDQLRTKAIIYKARKLLNYNPQTTLLEGVKEQVDWYKKSDEV